ncbi:ATP-binding protein [Proteiniclasticum ruminis]|uniref:ATP-binding protein n=1 Tax=Proteiniclasticum ruminis TaxID=398199 RepID=UPI0028AB940B|nr:ATP-binding protein [Proteiniclasticum ruminis]
MKLELSVKNQSIETSGITKDYKEALCEYIWNGFEANATQVMLSYVDNGMGGVSEVIIEDNGDGINFASLEDTFGTFLASQKSGLSLQLKSRANKGKGRFSFSAFALNATWETTFSDENSRKTYKIILDDVNKKECDVSDVPTLTEKPTGTKVSILGIMDLTSSNMLFEELEETFLKSFAWYLYLNKNKNFKLLVNGIELDYKKYINDELSTTEKIVIDNNSFDIAIVIWNKKIRENFSTYYLNEAGIVCGKDTTTFNRNTVDFNHSVFVSSKFFYGKTNVSLSDIQNDEDNQMVIEETTKEKTVLKKLKKAIQSIISEILNQYMSGQAEKAINGMMERNSFPDFSNDIYGEMRKKDLAIVAKELYQLDSRIFYKLKPVQEKSFLGFLNLLLSSEERENVLTIVEGIVELTPQQRSEFAGILKRTRLEHVISAIKLIESRYTVVEALKKIVFDYSKYANERDVIQKIVEQHYWLFGEKYRLVVADKQMQKALQEYLYILYGDTSPNAKLEPDEESARRMDIFACANRNTEDGFETEIEENLIVELKAPLIVLNKKVLRQIEDYMDFIRKQPSFNSQLRRWKFVAVCKAVDADIKSRYLNVGKKGLVTQIENYEIYALTWDDVFKSFEISHSHILERLKLDKEAIANEINEKIGNNISKTTVIGLAKELTK